MNIVYNSKIKKWQIVYNENHFINPKLWGKPVNNKSFDSYDEAMSYLDKCAE